MARAILGGGPRKTHLDDDCGSCGRRRGCGCGDAPQRPDEPGDGIGGSLPVLEVMLRQRVGYEEGIPQFDWVRIARGRSIVYENRSEWDAEIGGTKIVAKMVIPNTRGLDELPETAMIRERGSDVMWEITASRTTKDRIEIDAYRTWQEAPLPQGTVLIEE